MQYWWYLPLRTTTKAKAELSDQACLIIDEAQLLQLVEPARRVATKFLKIEFLEVT